MIDMEKIGESIDLLRKDAKRRETLHAILDDGPLTTYKLGERLEISTSAVEHRVTPLKELGLVDEEWREEGNNLKRYYEITEMGEKTLRTYYEQQLEAARAALGSFKDF